MNSLRSISAAIALSIAPVSIPLATIVASSLTLPACKTSQQTAAYKSVASLHAAVSSALSAWADYVVVEREKIAMMPDPAAQSAAAAVLLSRESLVRHALSRYQQAAAVARVGVDIALERNEAPAPGPLLAAGNDFIRAATSQRQ